MSIGEIVPLPAIVPPDQVSAWLTVRFALPASVPPLRVNAPRISVAALAVSDDEELIIKIA